MIALRLLDYHDGAVPTSETLGGLVR